MHRASWIRAGTALLVAAAVLAPAGSLAQAAAPTHDHVVMVDDTSIDPPELTVALGDRIHWLYSGTIPREIVEPTFGLFHSAPLLTGDAFDYVVAAAGTFDYRAAVAFTGFLPLSGRISVGAVLGRSTGRTFQLRWAAAGARLPDGLRFDVQYAIDRHGRVTWYPGRTLTAARAGRFPFRCNGQGRGGRARLRSAAGDASAWSPASTFVACID